MKVVLNDGRRIQVSWYYDRFEMPVGNTKRIIVNTSCKIFELSEKDKTQISLGVTHLSLKDNFCKDTGRKVSLTRALKNTNFTKADRQVIWNVYRSEMGKKKLEIVQ